FMKRTTAEWLKELEEVGLPCGPVNTIPQVVVDPQVQHRGMLREVTHHTAGSLTLPDTPIRLSRSESGIKGPPPDMGGDTAAVLHELLDLTEAETAELEARGVVATSGGP